MSGPTVRGPSDSFDAATATLWTDGCLWTTTLAEHLFDVESTHRHGKLSRFSPPTSRPAERVAGNGRPRGGAGQRRSAGMSNSAHT